MVIFGILVQQSGPSKEELWAKALADINVRDKSFLEADLEAYRNAGGDIDRINVLDGILTGASNRDPRAIEMLAPYLRHDDVELRQLATKYSATSYQRMGNSSSAEMLYKANLEMTTDKAESHLLLMQLYEKAGALLPAAKVAQDVLRIDPDNQLAALVVPVVYKNTGQFEEAIAAYHGLLDTESAIVSADPDVVTSYLDCLMAAGKEKKAVEFIQANSEYVSDKESSMDVFLKNGMLSEAEEILLRVGEAARDHFVQSSRIKAALANESGDSETAIAILRKAAMTNPRSPSVFEQLAGIAIEVGQDELAEVCQQNIRKLDEIRQQISDAVMAIGSDLESPDLRIAVAKLHLDLWNYGEATAWLRKGLYVAGPRQAEVTGMLQSLKMPQTMLFPFGAATSPNLDEESADGGVLDSKANDTASSSKVSEPPADESEDTEPEPAE